MKLKSVLRNALLLVAVLFCTAAYSQQTISGTVTGSNGEPLIGVNILIKGTSNGTTSDLDGNYSLTANMGDVLVFSYTGFDSQEITVGTSSTIDVVLEEGKALEEVVVVAYGVQKKVTVTGAVVALPGKDLVKSPAVDMSNSLAGRLPGVVVIQTSGEPGYDGATVTIRGTNTLGNSSPLIVIDGIPDRAGGLGRLNPADIESISVLKDASAAIYGARAANGAILITTKRGASGKPTLTYDFNQGFTQPTVVPNMSNAVEYANIMNEIGIYKNVPQNEWQAAWQALKTTGTYDSPTDGVATINANYSPEAVRLYGEGSDKWGYPDTDWFGDAFRTWAPQSRHNLQLSGGTDKLRYMTSLGYVHQDAIYKNSATYYNQYNFRMNLDANISDYIKPNVGIMVRREDRNFPTEGAGAIFRMLMRGRPTEPEVWPNGMPGPDIENGQNPYVITTNATGYVKDPTDYIQANGGVDITNPWIAGLKLTLSGSVDNSSRTTKTWQTPWMLYYWDRQTYGPDGDPLLVGAVRSNFKDPRLRQQYRTALNTNMTALLNYDKSFGTDHSLNVLAGVTRETFTGSDYFAFRRNYISAAVDQLFAGGSLEQNTGGSAYERARLGYYGRVQYNFREKYLAEFIWRYDGSYIFPESDRFGFFPGLLLGWNVSNEDFFNVPGIDYLKLRASYGQMGNDQVYFNNQLQEYAYLSTYGFGSYPIDGQVVTTLRETVLANPSFTWERANNLNFGLDATILNNMFDISLEYFYNKRDQILIQKTGSTPASSGISSLLPPVNAGKVDNKGFEFTVNYNNPASNRLRLQAGINAGYAKNKIVFMDEVKGAPEYQYQTGKPIGAYLVYQSDGVFKDQAEIEANTIDYSGVTGKLIPGDMKFVDYNGDGKIDADDQVRLDESITPTFNFGANAYLSYKNFDLSALLQGATGASIRIQTESGDIGNFLKYSYDHRWSIDNPSSVDPRLASRGDTYYTGGNFGNNTYYLFSKNYIRLKNLEIGYTITNELLNKANISNLRVYANALNLFTITANDVYDPETTNQSGQYYPQQRVLNIGASLTF
ncbi:MAG TPA: TonB-dependent receptor [Saprospiraceae bacterium]|nr:TonB-dependent receptor [Saprospiraceae bacterium]MCB9270462.1 TonB-dependent receptor [Lewinellaceae bacterium]HPG07466.1 TonB-dependent receptor [Saprospiraceae bacterium]HRV84974.1 TonB-dependent receptor [Saprospiraceae bacterium]